MTPDVPGPDTRPRRIPRGVVAAGAAGLAALSLVVAALSGSVATARDGESAGRTVSAEQLAAIRTAARSCPTLTPARLAGQLMTESGLDGRAERTASGGRGLAGLDDERWRTWAPWPDAPRTDAAANILALAHHMCDLAGQLRTAEVPGDPWRLSLAAFHTGFDEVRGAAGVPSAAVPYVDEVNRYAAYYGRQDGFTDAVAAGAEGERRQPKAVPAAYVRLVVRAGSVCPQVPPAAVAAQLMTLSGFDPNLLGDGGRKGIAQFRPELWRAYGPSGASPWEPQAAVPATGAALCALRRELAALDGDPDLLALAAYRNGTDAVRHTGGDFDAGTQAFLRTVREFTDFYALDGRLRGTPASSGSPPATTRSPKPTASSAARPSTPPLASGEPDRSEKPSAPVRPAGAKQLVGKETGLCASGGSGDGVRVVLRTCREERSQWWTFASDGSVRVDGGLCLDVAWGEKRDGVPVQTAWCSGNPAQKWEWIESQGRRSLFNRATDRCLDVDGHAAGAPLNAWTCVFNVKQTWSLR
ncbi:ricin-type beta-trefoil lectin domain protein [Micromonospora sp. WMMA1949]|uniref:ricin-type beta-trefoil lectin domain protein n=1 Tax=unclassified Micromonospora TaxID=2617518 RepID=UPI0022B67963|nr:ricin-type beta-trefoil lectin domain protein [Micromonospora sp. WMMA1949]MCZ7428890.1 ricin-type beta-trefoil lectin domain protein [Micromonospora sp. WMMA1949]